MSQRAIRVAAVISLIAVLALARAGSATIPGRTRALEPRCFGAAARDPRHPCRNRRLEHSVQPSLRDAAITPNLPCAVIETDGQGPADGAMQVCAFGAPPATAAATVALVGDSHAMAARASLDVAARAKGWRALALTRASCPLSTTRVAAPPSVWAACRRWRGRVLAWFGRHPEVSVAFVAQFASHAAPGHTRLEAEKAGYVRDWQAMPRSVSHIVVIRDNARVGIRTFDCIRRALTRKRSPG